MIFKLLLTESWDSVQEMLEADASNAGRLSLLQAIKKLVNTNNEARLLFIDSLRVVIWSLTDLSADDLGTIKDLFQDVDIGEINVM